MSQDPAQALAAVVPPELRDLLRGRQLVLARPVGGPHAGRHTGVRAGLGDQFRGHRPYSPGDDPRRIDWRAVARRDRLVLRQTDAEDALSLVLLVDAGGGMSYGIGSSNKLRHASALAGALAHLALRQGDSLGFGLGRAGELELAQLRPRAGASRLAALAHALTREPAGICPWPDLVAAIAPSLPRRSLVLLLSDLLDPDPNKPDADELLLRNLAALRSRGHDVVLVQVLHRDELEFPWTERGMLRFEDPRGAREPLEGHAPGLRADYLERLHAHLAGLDRGCADAGLHLHRSVSDEPLTGALLALLARLAGHPEPAPLTLEARR
jgi:uncharacterized protein (DUF58 family)